MQFYFKLQYTRTYRILKEAGFNPLIIGAVVFIAFIFASEMLFNLTSYAKFIYLILLLSIIYNFGSVKRNNFLKICFSAADYKKIRLLENAIVALPFSLFLVYQQAFVIALLSYILALTFSFIVSSNNYNFVIPTPFHKQPFEFIVGFRKTYFVFIAAYILTYIAISVDNFNLSAFSLIIVYLTSLNFYSKLEPSFYVWIYAVNAPKFLLKKVKTACFYSVLLSLPIVIALIAFYPLKTHYVIIVEVIGILFVVMNLLGKYAFFPSNPNITQGIIIVFCLSFPPITLLVIPYFYSQAKQKLQTVLK